MPQVSGLLSMVRPLAGLQFDAGERLSFPRFRVGGDEVNGKRRLFQARLASRNTAMIFSRWSLMSLTSQLVRGCRTAAVTGEHGFVEVPQVPGEDHASLHFDGGGLHMAVVHTEEFEVSYSPLVTLKSAVGRGRGAQTGQVTAADVACVVANSSGGGGGGDSNCVAARFNHCSAVGRLVQEAGELAFTRSASFWRE